MDSPVQQARGLTADELDGAIWQKSSYSGTHGNCVEVATNLPGLVAVRDSKDPEGARLVVSPEGWREFIMRVREREFTLG
jgi:hypothetical protein